MKRLKRELSNHARRIKARLKRNNTSTVSTSTETCPPKSARSTTRSVAVMEKPCTEDHQQDSSTTLRSVGSQVGILYLSREESREEEIGQINNANSAMMTNSTVTSGSSVAPSVASQADVARDDSESLGLNYVDFQPRVLDLDQQSDSQSLTSHHTYETIRTPPETTDVKPVQEETDKGATTNSNVNDEEKEAHLQLVIRAVTSTLKEFRKTRSLGISMPPQARIRSQDVAVEETGEEEKAGTENGGNEEPRAALQPVTDTITATLKELNHTYKEEKKASKKLEREQRLLEALLQELHSSRRHIKLIEKHTNASRSEKENLLEMIQETAEAFDAYDYERAARQDCFELYLKYKGIKTSKDAIDVLNAINVQKLSLLKLESLVRKRAAELKRNPPKNALVALKPLTFHIAKSRVLTNDTSKREPTGGRDCVINIVDAPREPVIMIDGFQTNETLV